MKKQYFSADQRSSLFLIPKWNSNIEINTNSNKKKFRNNQNIILAISIRNIFKILKLRQKGALKEIFKVHLLENEASNESLS